MWIVISPNFIKYFTPKQVSGISIFPFIILEKDSLKEDKTFINHELIHIYQQMELLFIFFILLYYMEFFIRFVKLGISRKPIKASLLNGKLMQMNPIITT